jgi:hypothetical protein
MSRAYAEGLRDFKQAVFEDIKGLAPALEKAFPDYTIVIRPHPTENPKVYQDIAAKCERVVVTNEGNVIPWLVAAKALVHNSCTTGVEAYIMGVPAVTYMKSRDEYYDMGYYRLPNSLSHRCGSFNELRETLGKIFSGALGAADDDDRKKLMNEYLEAQEGSLACERIVDVIEKIIADRRDFQKPALQDQVEGWYRANWRRLVKWFKSHLPDSKYRPEFQRHRYPGLSLEDLRKRISLFQRILGDNTEIKTEQLSEFIFKISAT